MSGSRVESYLKWVLAEKGKVTKQASQKTQEERKILKGVLGAMMTYCHENSQEFQNNIDLFEDHVLKDTLKRMLHRVKEGHYVARLFLKGKGAIGSIQTVYARYKKKVPDNNARLCLNERDIFTSVYGNKHDIPAGLALLQLNERLPKADRLQLRDACRDCLNAEGVISPIRVKSWLIPALKEFFEALQESEIEGYVISCVGGHHRDGFSVILGCASGQGEPISITLQIEVAVQALGWPSGLNLQHPLPRKQQYAQFGQELLKSIREDFEMGHISLAYTSKMVAAPKGPESDDVRKRVSRSQKAKEDAADIEEKQKRRLWKVDTGDIEERMLSTCMKYNGLVELTKAVALYNILSKLNSSVLPEIRPGLQKTLALWLIKKRADKTHTWMNWFKALCDSVLTMLKTSHCQSFCHTNHNVASNLQIPEKIPEVMAEFLGYLDKDDVDKVKEMLNVEHDETESDGEDITGTAELDEEEEEEEGSVFVASLHAGSEGGSYGSHEEKELRDLTESEY